VVEAYGGSLVPRSPPAVPLSSFIIAGDVRGQQLAALQALHRWLDSWSGMGQIAAGMAREGFDLQLTRYDERG